MKKLLFILILLVTTPAFANGPWGEITCENNSEYAKFANECDEDKFEPDTNTENGNEAGGGADVVLWQSEDEEAFIEEVIAEYRFDSNSRNQKIYGVVRVNLWAKIKRFFGK